MMNDLSPIPMYWSVLKENMPDRMITSNLRMCNNVLVIGGRKIQINAKINILAYGKASVSMYQAAKAIVGDRYFGRGLLVTHESVNLEEFNNNKECAIESTHPLITNLSYIAGKRVQEFVKSGRTQDILLVLVSGGGSAMLALPIDSISLDDKIDFISRVMHMSVPEREVNVLKKALSKIKGGKLAELAPESVIVNCILSDEREHELSAISSGMTVCNESIKPIDVMDTYQLWDVASEPIKKALLEHGSVSGVGCSKDIANQIIGSRDNLIDSFVDRYVEFGFQSINIMENMHSCTPEFAAERLAKGFNEYYDLASPGKHLVVSTGEVQVNAQQFPEAKGGRNQHLAALLMLKFKPKFRFFFVAIATDGMDYLDGVHGAYYNSQVQKNTEEEQNFIQASIDQLESYKIHKKFQTLLEGPKTGTNMSDFFLFTFEKTA